MNPNLDLSALPIDTKKESWKEVLNLTDEEENAFAGKMASMCKRILKEEFKQFPQVLEELLPTLTPKEAALLMAMGMQYSIEGALEKSLDPVSFLEHLLSER